MAFALPWGSAMLKCPEPRSRVRYVPEALEVVEEAEDGTFSENIGMFAAGEELLAFRREISRKAQLDESLLTPSHSSASHQPRPARLLDILPFAPWCGKCMPQAPDGQLPLKPDELVLGQASDIQALTENINEYGMICHSPKRGAPRRSPFLRQDEGMVKFHNRQSRIEQLGERLHLTATHPMKFFQRTVETPEDIELMPGMTRSRFSKDDFTGYDVKMNPEGDSSSDTDEDSADSISQVPTLLKKFTTEQVSRMELVALNHVKIQVLKKRIAEEGAHSVRARRTFVQTKFSSLWQLLRMRQDGSITAEENYYLMMQLRGLPFFNEISSDLHDAIVEQTTTQTYVPGGYLFQEGDDANSLFLILTGQVNLRSETHVAMAYDKVKSAPALLLPQDLFSQSRGQPFVLRKQKDRIRTQSAVASLRNTATSEGSGGPSTTVAFIFPESILEFVSKHFREKEAENRWHIVRHFAKQQRLSVQVCSKHQEVFQVMAFPRSYLFINAGSKPPLEEAHLYFVMEGELSVVYPVRKDSLGRSSGKARKETVGKGSLIGEAALYGEAYPCAVVSTSEVKVLVLTASDYLHQLMNRSSVLSRPEGYVPPEGPVGDAAQVKGRRKLIQETTSFTAKTLRLKKDQVHVKDREWKALQLRAEMPSKVPPGGHHRLLSMAKNQGRTNNLEEVPETFVQKVPVIPDAGRSGDGYLTRSMNQKLSSTSRDLQQLQAAHRSHTAFHYHVEELRRGFGRGQTPRAGSRMLMACGAMSPCPRSRILEPEGTEDATCCWGSP